MKTEFGFRELKREWGSEFEGGEDIVESHWTWKK